MNKFLLEHDGRPKYSLSLSTWKLVKVGSVVVSGLVLGLDNMFIENSVTAGLRTGLGLVLGLRNQTCQNDLTNI